MTRKTMDFVANKPATEGTSARLPQLGGLASISLPMVAVVTMEVVAETEVVGRARGSILKVGSPRKTLADRLEMSPKTPEEWYRDSMLLDGPTGRELL